VRSFGTAVLRVALVAALLAAPAARAQIDGFPGRPLRLGLDVGASAEGTEPFEDVVGRLSNRLERPVLAVAYQDRASLVEDFRLRRVDLLLVGCAAYQDVRRARPGESRALARLVLNGRPRYDGLILASAGRGPDRPVLMIPSRESEVGRPPRRLRRAARVEPAGGSLEALIEVLEGRAHLCAITDLAYREARRQGLAVGDLEIQERLDDIPFEALLAGPEVPQRLDARLRAALLRSKTRSPAGVAIEWRTVDDSSLGLECFR